MPSKYQNIKALRYCETRRNEGISSLQNTVCHPRAGGDPRYKTSAKRFLLEKRTSFGRRLFIVDADLRQHDGILLARKFPCRPYARLATAQCFSLKGKNGIQGFTLMELLVAVAVMAALLAGIMGVGSQYLGHMQQANSRRDELAALHAAFHLFERDIQSFHHGMEGGADQIRFIMTRPAVLEEPPQSGLVDVRWQARHNAQGSVSVERFERDALLDTPLVRTELLTVPKAHFSFRNKGLQMVPVWNAQQKEPPLIVAFDVTDASGGDWQRSVPILVQAVEK